MSAAPWPPTFSTAVFALGALATGKMLGIPAVSGVGHATAGATLALWVVTAALHASRLLPAARRGGSAPRADRDEPTMRPEGLVSEAQAAAAPAG